MRIDHILKQIISFYGHWSYFIKIGLNEKSTCLVSKNIEWTSQNIVDWIDSKDFDPAHTQQIVIKFTITI